jgi:helicase MOV-10
LTTDFQQITAQIVLLGDHKQLGPVIESDFAAKLGLGVSLMERLMMKPRYQPKSGEYDKKYLMQLLDNYRSHPAILQFSNVQFYESKLRAKIAEPERSFAVKWQYLSNPKFPILFHCNKSPSRIMHGGTSSFNDGEIKMVLFYVNLLLNCGIDGKKVTQNDIGIVSPYKAQLNKLRDALSHVRDIEIGTAEYYQGREKKIVIISTVKSRDNVGFLKSEKVSCVAILLKFRMQFLFYFIFCLVLS